MEYTRSDLLQRVELYRPKPDQHRDSSRKKEVKEFSPSGIDPLMSCHDCNSFLGIRDRAIAALVLATGLRVTAAAELPLAHYEPSAGLSTQSTNVAVDWLTSMRQGSERSGTGCGCGLTRDRQNCSFRRMADHGARTT